MSFVTSIDHREHQVALVRYYLENRAHDGEIVFYGSVMAQIGLSPMVPADRTAIGGILDAVSHQTWSLSKKKRHLLSAIVHRKRTGKTCPGPGFDGLLKNLKGFPDWEDKDEMLAREMKRVWAYYQ